MQGKKLYTQKDMDEMRSRMERSANVQIRVIQDELKADAKRFKDATYHNCDLFEQVILFVAVKRCFNFGENEMVKIGETAAEISSGLAWDKEDFAKLKEELATVGFEVDEELMSFEREEKK